ncbi:hypothetical protein ASG17_07440 [Brevundimonas sp. Leaf363]|uniref:hypothetical protein n=1 Tax=Brevundimonas sp. Leaf363 TaxID=1736353 RepID=UPI0006F9C9A2|nr:hypothetical protein [Brevundimonas sp. Leaf363]KQS55876.1 hypothetical protein ASG17_07440 [Brevundimonas sp. Leaf363]
MTRLRTIVTQADLDQLKAAHKTLTDICVGLHPACNFHPPLYAAIATVKACAVDWSGRPDIWSSSTGKLDGRATPDGQS